MFKRDIKTEELIRCVEAMSKEEQELILDHVPVELCLARVSKEIEGYKEFVSRVYAASNTCLPNQN